MKRLKYSGAPARFPDIFPQSIVEGDVVEVSNEHAELLLIRSDFKNVEDANVEQEKTPVEGKSKKAKQME